MSGLRLTFDHLQVPHEDCNQSNEQVSPPDECHVVVSVTDSAKSNPAPAELRKLRFDRNGEEFVVSLKAQGGAGEFLNNQDDVSWFFSHEESAQILRQVRIFGHFLPSKGVAKPTASERESRARLPMVVAYYILSGKVAFPDQKESLEERDLAALLLNVFANSAPEAVRELIGRIAYFQADAKLDSKSQDRARWIVSILQSIPNYEKFLQRLLPAGMDWNQLSEDDFKAAEELQSFAANAVVNLGFSQSLRYDEATDRAYRAYRKLHAKNPKARDFCQSLERALSVLPAVKRRLDRHFVSECRMALELMKKPPRIAAAESLKRLVESSRGQEELQQGVFREVRRSNMAVGWLRRRGQIDATTRGLFSALRFVSVAEQGSVAVHVDTPALDREIRRLVAKTRASRHREPVMASLALLRWMFGKNAERKQLRIFSEGQFQEVPLRYSEKEIQELLVFLESELRLSLRASEIGLPLGEGAVTALGGAGLGLALGLKGLRPGAKNGLGYAGAGLLGFGSGALITHFIVPPLAKRSRRPVRNKYLWDLVGGVIGASVGLSVWGATAGRRGIPDPGQTMPVPDPGMRYPVDEHGP